MVQSVLFTVFRAFAYLCGHSVENVSQTGLSQQILEGDMATNSDGVLPLRVAEPYRGTRIPNRKDWIVTCDSFQDVEHNCSKTMDGLENTFWLTKRTSGSNSITINLGTIQNINGLAVLPRQDQTQNGIITGHEVYVSRDGKEWGRPVAYGTWWTDNTEKNANFEPTQAQYIRLVALSDAGSSTLTSIAELNVYITRISTNAPASLGRWGPTIDTPLVAASAFVDPTSGNVVLMSSKAHDGFPQDPPAFTLTSIFDPIKRTISQATKQSTGHNMFCPGMSFDANGRMLVSGGINGKKTSIFDPTKKVWELTGDMNIPRGYQSSVTCANGKIFVIGGSWGADAEREQPLKYGEIYDPGTKSWTRLPQCPVEPLLTHDGQGRGRQDNHIWLFGWKENTVFQAGPSLAMNWYSTADLGGWKAAGNRYTSNGTGDGDDDAMCGMAVMYDASNGKILTAGGAPTYEKLASASDKAFVLTLGDANSTVDVERINRMSYRRSFASAIVLPNGDTFVTGGQSEPENFSDRDPVLEPELYSPKTKSWTKMAPNSIVRVYHSFGFLLPDATILTGGGGLCSDCLTNHFDAQVYTPPYLLDQNGGRMKQPVIAKISTGSVKPGGSIDITTDSAIQSASLIRYSSATHAVNTDQRRIALELSNAGSNAYRFSIPSNGGIATPGYWMLFVINSDGVPSVAKTVQINPT